MSSIRLFLTTREFLMLLSVFFPEYAHRAPFVLTKDFLVKTSTGVVSWNVS